MPRYAQDICAESLSDALPALGNSGTDANPMKVNRRRTLFYPAPDIQPVSPVHPGDARSSPGSGFPRGWTAVAIRNPFDPTPTSTRTINSWTLEGEAYFKAGSWMIPLGPDAISAYQQAATRSTQTMPSIWAELARIQAYSSRLLSNDADRLARLTEALQSADQAVALAPEDSKHRGHPRLRAGLECRSGPGRPAQR